MDIVVYNATTSLSSYDNNGLWYTTGITSIQEVLYYSIPVIGFLRTFDQFDTGPRLDLQGLRI